MNYRKIYDSLIKRARTRILECYTETHHVIPICMNGPDTSKNKVELTPEEHYVAHQLLVKLHPKNNKLIFAAHMMCCGRPNNKLYGWLRRKHAIAVAKIDRAGRKNGSFQSRWVTNGKINQKISKTDKIPTGWKLGRFIVKTRFHYDCICSQCQKSFKSKSKRKTCSLECQKASRPDIVRDNFISLHREYETNGHVISKAFIACGIGFNNNTFARFRKLLSRVGSVATAPLL